MGSRETEKDAGSKSDFLKDPFDAEEGAVKQLWAVSDAFEVEDEPLEEEKDKPDIQSPKPVGSKGWLQRLIDGLSPVDSERAIGMAHQKYTAYCQSQDIALADEAFKNFMEASAGIRAREWRLLHGCTSAALAHYTSNGRTQQDLQRLVRMGSETMASWTSAMNPPDYGVRTAWIIAKANRDVYLQSTNNEGVDEAKGEEAFKIAQKCFTKVIDSDDNNRAANLSRSARIELGIMITKRCRRKKTVADLDTAIAHLEHALEELGQLEDWQAPTKAKDTLRCTSQLSLAYYTVYTGQVRNTLAYPFNGGRRLNSVDSALKHLETTRVLAKEVQGANVDLARLQLKCATLHLHRWLETKRQSDAEDARAALETARVMAGANKETNLLVNALFNILASNR